MYSGWLNIWNHGEIWGPRTPQPLTLFSVNLIVFTHHSSDYTLFIYLALFFTIRCFPFLPIYTEINIFVVEIILHTDPLVWLCSCSFFSSSSLHLLCVIAVFRGTNQALLQFSAHRGVFQVGFCILDSSFMCFRWVFDFVWIWFVCYDLFGCMELFQFISYL